ncbi:MAG: hypothetical protein JXR44_01310 [Thiotrichales bacterium]|nr:hypothetical protein [Thiotrichales bacterium]
MLNSRRFFRFDLSIPFLLLTQSDWQKAFTVLHTQEMQQEQLELQHQGAALKRSLAHLAERGAALYPLLAMLDQRLEYYAWLLGFIWQQQDPLKHPEYRFRGREDAKRLPPQAQQDSPTLHLLAGLYAALDQRLQRLRADLEHALPLSEPLPLWTFSDDSNAEFSADFYVSNLAELATKGVAVAAILQSLIDRYNLLSRIQTRLAACYHPLNCSAAWPQTELNLSMGGLAFTSTQTYPLFQEVWVRLGLDAAISVKGKVLYCRSLPVHQGKAMLYRVAIELALPSSSVQQRIEGFMQQQELNQAIQRVPQVAPWPMV